MIEKLTDVRAASPTGEDFHITPLVEGAIALAQKERQEEEAAKESAALAVADGIISLVRQANLDAALANGWSPPCKAG